MFDGLVNFNLEESSPTIIKVVGVGGGGGNAIEYMFAKGIRDVDFVLCNTDVNLLNSSRVPLKIQLGKQLSDGYGAGNDPEVGFLSAQESIKEIRSMLHKHTKMVFITAGMGGGTGTGAAPLIAQEAKEYGILTIGVVTIPPRWEGQKRLNQAREGLEQMKNNVDCLIVMDTQRIMDLYKTSPLPGAFDQANEVLNAAVKGIAEIITLPGFINVDFADVKTVMSDSGVAVIGTAQASGVGRAVQAINDALESPLLNNSDICGSKYILLNITSGTDEITMNEMTDITSIIVNKVGNSAEVIWGVGTDEKLGDAISVTIIATGFPNDDVENWDKVVNDKVVARLTLEEVPLQPGMKKEDLEKLENIPAINRRNLKITN
ncbi:hypothetical protein FACS1894199_05450 [Bacteroidia bacterium]|nr:hypothetical protein FACS1894199_05450 [Bacteroidia bacterium]